MELLLPVHHSGFTAAYLYYKVTVPVFQGFCLSPDVR